MQGPELLASDQHPPDQSGFYRALLDSLTEGVCLAGDGGRIVYANPAEERMFGYEPGELVGQSVVAQSGYEAEDAGVRIAAALAQLKQSGSWRGEWRNRRKDGATFETDVRITIVEFDGQPHWLFVHEDVSEERAAVAALRGSEARLEIATAAADMGVWDWDLISDTITYSPRARAICGLPAEDDLHRDAVRATVHPDDLPRTSAMAARALDPAIRERQPYEYRVIWPDGTVHWVLAHGEVVFEDEGAEPRAVRYVGAIQDITERRRLEEAERAGAQRLSLAIDAGRMAVWEVEVGGEAPSLSPEMNRLLGFAEDAVPTIEQIRERYCPGEQEKLQAAGQAAVARGERFLEIELRFIWPDGSLHWLLLRCEIQFDDQGAPTKAVGVMSDITERKRTEEALRTSEARLELARQAAGAAIWDWDAASSRIVWSADVYALHGIDPALPDDQLRDAWMASIHPDDRSKIMAVLGTLGSEGAPNSIDYRVVHPGGEVRWVRSQGIFVPGPDGRAASFTGINIDVTDQHRQEEQLRAQAATLETTVQTRTRERDRMYALSNDLFAVGGFDGYLKTINPAWSRLLGFSEAQLLSRSFMDLVHPDDHAAAQATVAAMAAGDSIQRFEVRTLCADGSSIWVAWAAVPEGDLFYAVGRDVTRDREREEALRQSQKMEAVGQLTGGIAHDFNNLLQAVHGNLDLIRRRAEDERIQRWAGQGLQAAERGAKLTGQLLAFSRAQKPELRPVPAAELIAEMKDMVSRALGPMVRVTLDLSGQGEAVLADPTQLEMAVLNLAINARDAMAEGGELTIRTEACRLARDPELPSGDYLKIEVSDTGSGMPPEVAQRAFDPFFTTKGVGKGTGLGLSQVYGMAKQAGGAARIVTRPGEGTTVTLLLRRTKARAGDAAETEAGALSGAVVQATVLIVDDDPDVRRFLVDSLEALGYTVVQAEDGISGLAALDRVAPDLLLVDFAMPGMTGAEVATAARGRRPDLPIVFASGYADTAAIDAAVGPDAPMLRKPFRLDELEAVVSNALALP